MGTQCQGRNYASGARRHCQSHLGPLLGFALAAVDDVAPASSDGEKREEGVWPPPLPRPPER